MSKTYPLPLAADYLDHWSVEDGVREIIQNYLDSDGAGEIKWSEGEDGWDLSIRSAGIQLCQSLLVLGNGTKDTESDELGGFGEGFKLALLVITREGINVRVDNGGKVWTPKFGYSDLFNTTMLCIEEKDNHDDIGLRFLIQGLSDEQKDAIINNTLALQEDVERAETEYGAILPQHKGRVYVGGLFVCNTDLDYGYDFKPSVMRLNRDRKSVEGWDMKLNAQRMHFEETRADKVAGMIFDKCPDMDQVQYRWDVPEQVVDACFMKHVQESGEVPVAESHSELQTMKAQGITNAVFYGNEGFSKLVKQSANYSEMEQVEVLTPKDILLEFFSKHKGMSLIDEGHYNELITTAEEWDWK
tara:strand:- start:50639 stop:51712 length:1074 start_codon:yes stop_codon:yes gene_type:complete